MVKSADHHVLSCLFYCCRDANGFTFKLMWTELINMTFSAIFDECRHSGQLTDAPPLSRLSSEALCKGLLLGLVALTWTKARPCKMSFLSDEAESCWLDSSRWLEVAEEQLLRVAVLRSVCGQSAIKVILWFTAVLLKSRRSWTLTPILNERVCSSTRQSAIDETLRSRERGRVLDDRHSVFCSPDGRATASVTHRFIHVKPRQLSATLPKTCCRTVWLPALTRRWL